MSSAPKKAFLLAAGHGTRMRPLTDHTPKCLLPIRGVPMLQIWLDRCRLFGIQEVLINLHSHGDAVRKFLLSRQREVRVKIIEEPILLGSAGTVFANREWVANEPEFWIFYADVLTDLDLLDMVSFHRKRRPSVTLGVCEVPDPSRCGVVQLDADGMVTQFVEKPAVPVGRLAFAGVLLANQELTHSLPSSSPADIGFDLLPKLVGKMAAYRINSYLIDVGTPANYQIAQESWPGVACSTDGETCFEA